MNRLYFDTETTGLVQHKLPNHHPTQPFLVQLAGAVVSPKDKILTTFDILVRPDGRYSEMPQRAYETHGFSYAQAQEEGIGIRETLEIFSLLSSTCDVGICHNKAFDVKLMEIEYERHDIGHSMPEEFRCTMLESTDYCEIPGRYGFKWPTLQELHTVLFGTGFEDAHNAMVDINHTIKCHIELKKRGVMS